MTFQQKDPLKPVVLWSSTWLLLATLIGLGFQSEAHTFSSMRLEDDPDERPSLSLRSSASVAFSSSELLFIAELKGGADDYQEFYCPSIEWDWDDATRSESTYDCEPYEPGKTKIQRRYSARHTFTEPGTYEIRFMLKKRSQVLTYARTKVRVRYGLPTRP